MTEEEDEFKSKFPARSVCFHCDQQTESFSPEELLDHYKWIHDFDMDLTYEQLYVRLKTMGVM